MGTKFDLDPPPKPIFGAVDGSTLLNKNGYEVLENIISHEELDQLNAAVSLYDESGTRTLLRDSTIKEMANKCLERHPALRKLVPLLATYLPKSENNNWFVSLHRDEVVPIQQYQPNQGWTLPTVKEGIPHAKPPRELLRRCLALRLQLTDTREGALNLIPGSHDPSNNSTTAITACVLTRGALLMSPAVLHASPKLKTPGNIRRVLHILYGPESPPEPFQWYSFDTIHRPIIKTTQGSSASRLRSEKPML